MEAEAWQTWKLQTEKQCPSMFSLANKLNQHKSILQVLRSALHAEVMTKRFHVRLLSFLSHPRKSQQSWSWQ